MEIPGLEHLAQNKKERSSPRQLHHPEKCDLMPRTGSSRAHQATGAAAPLTVSSRAQQVGGENTPGRDYPGKSADAQDRIVRGASSRRSYRPPDWITRGN